MRRLGYLFMALVAVLVVVGIFLQYQGHRDLGHFLIGGGVLVSVLYVLRNQRANRA